MADSAVKPAAPPPEEVGDEEQEGDYESDVYEVEDDEEDADFQGVEDDEDAEDDEDDDGAPQGQVSASLCLYMLSV